MKTVADFARAMADLKLKTEREVDALSDDNLLVGMALAAFHDSEVSSYLTLSQLVGSDKAVKACAISCRAIQEAYRLEALCKAAGLNQGEILDTADGLVKVEKKIVEQASDSLLRMPAGKAH